MSYFYNYEYDMNQINSQVLNFDFTTDTEFLKKETHRVFDVYLHWYQVRHINNPVIEHSRLTITPNAAAQSLFYDDRHVTFDDTGAVDVTNSTTVDLALSGTMTGEPGGLNPSVFHLPTPVFLCSWKMVDPGGLVAFTLTLSSPGYTIQSNTITCRAMFELRPSH